MILIQWFFYTKGDWYRRVVRLQITDSYNRNVRYNSTQIHCSHINSHKAGKKTLNNTNITEGCQSFERISSLHSRKGQASNQNLPSSSLKRVNPILVPTWWGCWGREYARQSYLCFMQRDWFEPMILDPTGHGMQAYCWAKLALPSSSLN